MCVPTNPRRGCEEETAAATGNYGSRLLSRASSQREKLYSRKRAPNAHTKKKTRLLPDAGWKAASGGVWNAGTRQASRWCAVATAKGAKSCTNPAGTMAARFCDATFAAEQIAAAFCQRRRLHQKKRMTKTKSKKWSSRQKEKKKRRRPPRPCYYWRRTWGRRRDILVSPAAVLTARRSSADREMLLVVAEGRWSGGRRFMLLAPPSGSTPGAFPSSH
jgi:hypothetical protein